jgi:hypothetical protein
MVTERSVGSLLAAVLLAMACAVDGSLRWCVGLPLVLAALVTAARALGRGTGGHRALPSWMWTLLAAVAALGVVSPSTGGPSWFEWLRRAFGVCGVWCVGLASGPSEKGRHLGIRVAIGSATLLALLTPWAIPNPQIDVVAWTNTALRALLSGVHPYTVMAPDVYRGTRDFGFVVVVYPYMPATLLALAPFEWLFHEYRYALAVCLPLTVWLLRRIGRRQRASTGVIDFATLLLVLHPANAMMVRSGWGEPLLAAVALGAALAAVADATLPATIGLLLLPAFKQYVLPPPFLWFAGPGRRVSWRSWGVAAAVACATVAPCLVWNSRATLDGILFQVRAPAHARLTSLSLPGLLENLGVWNLPMWVSVATQAVVSIAIAWGGVAADVPGLFLGSSVALLATFAVGWQGFVNYYVFIGTLLIIAAVADRAEGVRT